MVMAVSKPTQLQNRFFENKMGCCFSKKDSSSNGDIELESTTSNIYWLDLKIRILKIQLE